MRILIQEGKWMRIRIHSPDRAVDPTLPIGIKKENYPGKWRRTAWHSFGCRDPPSSGEYGESLAHAPHRTRTCDCPWQCCPWSSKGSGRWHGRCQPWSRLKKWVILNIEINFVNFLGQVEQHCKNKVNSDSVLLSQSFFDQLQVLFFHRLWLLFI